jgi:HD domain
MTRAEAFVVGQCNDVEESDLASLAAAAKARGVAVHLVATPEEALERVESCIGDGPLSVRFTPGLVSRVRRPRHVHAGCRIGLSVSEVLACLHAEGLVAAWSEHDWKWTLEALCNSRSLIAVVIVAERFGERYLERLIEECEPHEADAWRCRDARRAVQCNSSIVDMRCEERTNWPGAANWQVHHASASPIGRVGETIRSAPGRSLWVSPAEAFAACFGCDAVRFGGVIQGFDRLASTPEVVISCADGLRPQEVDGSTFYLHRISARYDALQAAGACTGHEWILVGEGVIEEIVGPLRASEVLGRLGVRIEEASAAAPSWLTWCERASDQRLHDTFGMPRTELMSYESLRRQVGIWLPDELRVAPSRVGRVDAAAVIRLLRRCVLPEAAAMVRYPTSPAHGLRHAWIVSHFAAMIAMMEDQPPLAPAAAAVLHDCARRDDSDDDEHPRRGSEIAKAVLPQMRSLNLPRISVQEAVDAIARHSLNDVAQTSVEAVLRDADRLSLAWERGVDAKWFATRSGFLLARMGAGNAEARFRWIFSMPLFHTVGFEASPRTANGRTSEQEA